MEVLFGKSLINGPFSNAMFDDRRLGDGSCFATYKLLPERNGSVSDPRKDTKGIKKSMGLEPRETGVSGFVGTYTSSF